MKKLILSIVITLWAMQASAGLLTVTRTDDPAPDGCNPGDCSLREAVIAANDDVALDEINLSAGTYTLDLKDGFDGSEDEGDLDVSTDLTIRGAPSVLDAQELGRILDIRSGANVTLEDLTLQNANTSLDTNGSNNAGALSINGGSLTATRVTFANNRANSLGGAIWAFGDAIVTIEYCTFTDNSAGDGAGIFATAQLTISNTLFHNNRADQSVSGNGGALYMNAMGVTHHLRAVTMTQNFSTGAGGAMSFLGAGSRLEIENLVAVGNTTSGNSNGGVLSVPNTAERTVQITDSTFEMNEATSGGAITHAGQSDSMSIENSTFYGNTARDNGGALHISGGKVDITNVTFSQNEAADNGGGIYVSGNGTDVSVIHSTFANGLAAVASALFVTSSNVSVRMANNLLAGDCAKSTEGTLISAGGNVESPGNTCLLAAASDLPGQSTVQLQLQPLADNGGNTLTHQLGVASTARDNGDSSICALVQQDQRGAVRDNMCDAGSVEANGVADDLIFRYDAENADN